MLEALSSRLTVMAEERELPRSVSSQKHLANVRTYTRIDTEQSNAPLNLSNLILRQLPIEAHFEGT